MTFAEYAYALYDHEDFPPPIAALFDSYEEPRDPEELAEERRGIAEDKRAKRARRKRQKEEQLHLSLINLGEVLASRYNRPISKQQRREIIKLDIATKEDFEDHYDAQGFELPKAPEFIPPEPTKNREYTCAGPPPAENWSKEDPEAVARAVRTADGREGKSHAQRRGKLTDEQVLSFVHADLDAPLPFLLWRKLFTVLDDFSHFLIRPVQGYNGYRVEKREVVKGLARLEVAQ